MKRPATAALGTERFDIGNGMIISQPPAEKRRIQEPAISISLYKRTGEPSGGNRKPFLSLKCTAEQFKDVLWLMAAIAIISIIHRYISNSGAPPHSIVEVVRSANVFPE